MGAGTGISLSLGAIPVFAKDCRVDNPLFWKIISKAPLLFLRAGPYGTNRYFAEHMEKTEGPFPQRGPKEGLLMSVRNIIPVNGGGDWIITKPEHWMFEGTGIKKGDKIPGWLGVPWRCCTY